MGTVNLGKKKQRRGTLAAFLASTVTLAYGCGGTATDVGRIDDPVQGCGASCADDQGEGGATLVPTPGAGGATLAGGASSEASGGATLVGGASGEASGGATLVGGGEGGATLAAPESCELVSLETMADITPTDQCTAIYDCDGNTLEVSCDGENDGTNTSLCDCGVEDRAWTTGLVDGEAPTSCRNGLNACLALWQ